MSKRLKLIMPMAGNGSRFANVGITTPKPLIDIDGVPMFVFAERQLDLDFDERIFIVRKEHNIRDTVLEYYPDAHIIEVDSVTEGAACTLLLAREHMTADSAIFVSNCDQSVEWNNWTFKQTIVQHEIDAMVAVFHCPDRDPKWSYAHKDIENRVFRVAEKDPISDWATVGWYYWASGTKLIAAAEAMIAANDRVNNEFYVCPILNYNIKNTDYVRAFTVDSMHGIGTPEDLDTWKALHTK